MITDTLVLFVCRSSGPPGATDTNVLRDAPKPKHGSIPTGPQLSYYYYWLSSTLVGLSIMPDDTMAPKKEGFFIHLFRYTSGRRRACFKFNRSIDPSLVSFWGVLAAQAATAAFRSVGTHFVIVTHSFFSQVPLSRPLRAVVSFGAHCGHLAAFIHVC